MKKIILLIFIIIPILLAAQGTGVQFQRGISWKEVQAKAKAEHKYIFMDCFTTWCGPCRYMSTTIFPMDSVGDFMNPRFVSVAVQLDTTKNDNDSVKAWYQDGHDLAEKFHIRAYPTYLIFDPDGNAVHRFVGSSTADEFISKVKNGLDPQTQYYTLLNEYKNGRKDSAFLYKLALASARAYDLKNEEKIGNEYLNTQKNLYTKQNLGLMRDITTSSTDKGFRILLKNPGKADAVMGKGTAASIVQSIIMQEEVFKYFPDSAKSNPDWNKINKRLSKKYPSLAPELMERGKVIWYQHSEDWKNFGSAVMNLVAKYGADMSPDDLNNYAWAVFQNCKDRKCLEEALQWSKRSFKDKKVPGFIDTYANILYKLGNKGEAIAWEKKAKGLAIGDDKKGYQEVIDKFNKNEKTWN